MRQAGTTPVYQVTAGAVEKQHGGQGRRVRVGDRSRHKEREFDPYNRGMFLLCFKGREKPSGQKVRSVSTLASRQNEVGLLGVVPPPL